MTGPLPTWLAPLTVPASWLYGAAVRRRNARFDRAIGVQAIDRPVISVGNITTGGTGKTPMVHWLAEWMIEHRVEPAIAMRGYRAPGGHESDEAQVHKRFLPAVLLVVDPDRARALRCLLAKHRDIGVVLLDDGFQHRRLHRDLELVLIDASRATFDDRLLPAGHLREPLSNLARADAIIITNAPSVDANLKRLVERFHGRPPVAWTRHVWRRLWKSSNPSHIEPKPVDWLDGKRVVTLLGVGNPAAVRRQVEQAGATIAADVPARDHERFSRAKIARARALSEKADALLVTWKDWVRLREADVQRWPVPIVVPQVEIEVFSGLEDLEVLLKRCISDGRGSTRASPPAKL